MTDPTPILAALPTGHHVTGWTIAQLADWCDQHGIPREAVMVDYLGCSSHAVTLRPTGQPQGDT